MVCAGDAQPAHQQAAIGGEHAPDLEEEGAHGGTRQHRAAALTLPAARFDFEGFAEHGIGLGGRGRAAVEFHRTQRLELPTPAFQRGNALGRQAARVFGPVAREIHAQAGHAGHGQRNGAARASERSTVRETVTVRAMQPQRQALRHQCLQQPRARVRRVGQ